MNKKMIRLTESDIHRIVKESVNRILRETKGFDTVNKDGPLPINQFHPDWVYYQREQQGPYPEDYEEWFNPEDEDLSQKFEDAHERLHKKHYGKLSPQEIERMAEREVYGESKIGGAIRESVNRILNEIGDSEKSHEYLGTISGYYEAQGNRDKANRAYNLSTRLQKNRNNGQLYDPNSEESASEYRRNSYAYTKGFDKGWDKGRRQMEEATADPRWWQKDGEFPDMKDTAYSKPKQQVKVSEAQLHQIVKESVNKLLKEDQLNELDPRTYASYAAKRQAQGQTNKAKDGEDAAIQAWNKQYGKKDTGTYDNVDDYGDRERIMRNNPYNNKGKYEVRTQYKDRGLGHLSTYRPTMDYNWDSDTEGYETQGKGYRPTQYLGIDNKGTRHYARREQSQQALQGYEVAKQMANNSGKYIKGKGWQ